MDAITKVWSEWKTESELGHGAFGRVYKVKREEFGTVSYAAVKVIQIPQDESEIRELENTGMDLPSIKAFFEGTVKNLVNEIQILTSLKTAGNIVSIEDYKIVRHEDGVRWSVYIRMELLESLTAYLSRVNTISEREVAQLGVDLCSALECCEQNHIIHRDIKPDNIFRNQYGTFKLGDFGISKQLEMTRNIMSQKGTSMYMAPEVYRGDKNYNQTVDIYALGITLYKLLNKGRFPFLPDAPAPLKPSDMEESMIRRMSGENVPAPKGIDPTLAQIVNKACSYNSLARYQHASEMKDDLMKWLMQGNAGENVQQQTMNQNFGTFMSGTAGTFNETASGTMGGNMFQQEKTENAFGADISQNEKTWSAYSNQGFMCGDDKTIGAPKQEIPKQEASKTVQSSEIDMDVRVTITITEAQAKAGGKIPVIVDGQRREQITFPANIQDNATYKFAGAGRSKFIQDPATGKKRYMAGTLYVTVHVQGGQSKANERSTVSSSSSVTKKKKKILLSISEIATPAYKNVVLMRILGLIIYYGYVMIVGGVTAEEMPRYGIVIAIIFAFDFINIDLLFWLVNDVGSLFVAVPFMMIPMELLVKAFSLPMGLGVLLGIAVWIAGIVIYVKSIKKYAAER